MMVCHIQAVLSLRVCVCVSPSSFPQRIRKIQVNWFFFCFSFGFDCCRCQLENAFPLSSASLAAHCGCPLCSSHEYTPTQLPQPSPSIQRYCHFCPLTALAFMQFCFWRVIDFMLLLLMVFFLWFKLISIMHKYGKPAICPHCPPESCPVPCPVDLSPTVLAPIQVMRMLKLPWHFFANSQYFFPFLMISKSLTTSSSASTGGLFYMYTEYIYHI